MIEKVGRSFIVVIVLATLALPVTTPAFAQSDEDEFSEPAGDEPADGEDLEAEEEALDEPADEFLDEDAAEAPNDEFATPEESDRAAACPGG